MVEPIYDIGQPIEYIVAHAKQEWAMITGAPVTLLVIVGILVAVIWYLNRLWYSHVIATKNGTIEILKHRHEFADDRLQLQRVVNELAQRTQTSTGEPPEQIVAAGNTKIDELSLELTDIRRQVAGLYSRLENRTGEKDDPELRAELAILKGELENIKGASPLSPEPASPSKVNTEPAAEWALVRADAAQTESISEPAARVFNRFNPGRPMRDLPETEWMALAGC
jgi:hypothetical protein